MDVYEEELKKAAMSGKNTMALIYTLATKGKDRGYGVVADNLSKFLHVALEGHYH